MDNSNVKQRDVLDFKTFIKSYETASKVVELKKGENAHPGAHEITGENLYVRHDANPYKVAGIKHDEKQADINNFANANQVDVQGKEHDGQDPTGAKTNEKSEPTKADKKAADEAAALVGNAFTAASDTVSESTK